MASPISDAYGILCSWGHNLKMNTIYAFTNMEAKNYIRLIAVVGAYLLLRPYLIKLGAKVQRKEHEKVDHPPEHNPAKISANALRGQVEVTDDTDDEGTEAGNVTAGEFKWGKKARKRQRQVIKKLLEAEEQRLQELEDEEEDEGLEDFLAKYGATGKEVGEVVLES